MTDSKLNKQKKSVIQVRVDPDIKQHLERVLSSNGMTISEAVRLYFWQIITQGGVPFKGFVSNKLPVRSVPSKAELELQEEFMNLQKELLGAEIKNLILQSEIDGDDDDEYEDEYDGNEEYDD